MQSLGGVLVVMGLLIAGVGCALLFGLSFPWLGKLPGDIVVERENFRFYFPLMTCIVLSVLLTGVLWVVRFFSR